ncbi:MAG: hypothetical protein NTX17_03795 [Candidatus Eisenbacteria bacterium]|nr:hypothetical protein [Candidatus Eisenbacteria bacterium]
MSRVVASTSAALLILFLGCMGQEHTSSDKAKSLPTRQYESAATGARTPQEVDKATTAPTTSPTDPHRSGQARDRITAINPSKIHIDSEGRIVTKDLSYEEMGKLAEALAEADESGELQSSREYDVSKDNRGRTTDMSERPQGEAAGEWRVEFEYTDPQLRAVGIADAARAIDEHGNVLAQATLLRLLTGEGNQFKGAEVEERHFDARGRVYFSCKSQFSFPLGRKTGESDARGRRTRDYFSQWPLLAGIP